MLTKRKSVKRRKLSREILGLSGIAAAVSFALFFLLITISSAVAETYVFYHDIPMTEFDWIAVNRWIFLVGAVIACISFSVLFLLLLSDRIAYIRTITEGIGKLHSEQKTPNLPLRGNNELTELAGAINFMSEAQRQLREKEQALAQEKEQLIRTLSHDIRTPLTSILAYSDYLSAKEEISAEEQREYTRLIQKKAEQIRDLTAILLDGGRRNLEHFEDARLLMEQLAAEFEEELEERFRIAVDLSACELFSGNFDVQELRRIFDNLSSNVQKYADPAQDVKLSIGLKDQALWICQSNGISRQKPASESFQIGLNSIRRLVQLYGGQVSVTEGEQFSITMIIPV